jgi:hypothetical protein
MFAIRGYCLAPPMKTFLQLAAVICLLPFGASAQLPNALQAPVTARDISIEKISPSFVSTPEFTTNIPNKRSESLKWFEIEVEFETKVEMIDELTFVYTAFLNGKLFTGEVTHVNIAKGRNHFSVMYISPRNLDKITGGKNITAGMIENIEVEVRRNGMKLGSKTLNAKPMPNLERVTGLLSLKSETPFHVLWWDRYEAVKTAPSR